MDDLSHRMANALVGNDERAAALEVTLTGPTLKFHTACLVAVCGAAAEVLGELPVSLIVGCLLAGRPEAVPCLVPPLGMVLRPGVACCRRSWQVGCTPAQARDPLALVVTLEELSAYWV